MKKLVLASASPRRREILSTLKVPFEVRVSNANEDIDTDFNVYDIPKILAERKALAVEMSESEIIIGCDTVVILNNEIFGKPKNRENSIKMLEVFSGKSHDVVSGICIRTKDKIYSESIKTTVEFKPLTKDEIVHYVDTEKPFDKAGAYGIQEMAGAFVRKIDGDFYNVVGLPLNRLCEILENEFDINLLV